MKLGQLYYYVKKLWWQHAQWQLADCLQTDRCDISSVVTDWPDLDGAIWFKPF